MQEVDEGAEDRPFLHWPSLIHPAPQAYLSLPVPPPPTHSRLLGEEELQPEALANPAALAGVISGLQGVDVSYL